MSSFSIFLRLDLFCISSGALIDETNGRHDVRGQDYDQPNYLLYKAVSSFRRAKVGEHIK